MRLVSIYFEPQNLSYERFSNFELQTRICFLTRRHLIHNIGLGISIVLFVGNLKSNTIYITFSMNLFLLSVQERIRGSKHSILLVISFDCSTKVILKICQVSHMEMGNVLEAMDVLCYLIHYTAWVFRKMRWVLLYGAGRVSNCL